MDSADPIASDTSGLGRESENRGIMGETVNQVNGNRVRLRTTDRNPCQVIEHALCVDLVQDIDVGLPL